jgi:amidophosphoribosyltransferase
LREAGAAEVHLRIMLPPWKWPCVYGIDTGTKAELLAANMTVGEIENYLGVDSLAYLQLDRLIDAIDAPGAGFCTACLTGDYPITPDAALSKGVLDAVRA